MFLRDGYLVRQLIEEAARSAERLDLAIAYWGTGAVDELALSRAGDGTRVLLDATSGGTNPDALKALMACSPHICVRHLSGLHAKVVITGDSVIVGSANASAAGLGFAHRDADVHVEAAALLVDAEARVDASAWFEQQWTKGVQISDSILASAMAAWLRGAQGARLATRDDEEFPSEGVFVVAYGTHADPGVIESAEETLRVRGERRASAYQGWAKMPRDAILIDFWVERDGPAKATFQDVYRSFPNPEFSATRSDDGRQVKVYAVRSLPRAADELAKFGFTEGSLGSLIEALIRSYEEERGRGAPAQFRAQGGDYAHLRDWCIRIDGFLALCAARGLLADPERSSKL